MYFDAMADFFTSIQIGSGHTVFLIEAKFE
jgi:hypothetical protein